MKSDIPLKALELECNDHQPDDVEGRLGPLLVETGNFDPTPLDLMEDETDAAKQEDRTDNDECQKEERGDLFQKGRGESLQGARSKTINL